MAQRVCCNFVAGNDRLPSSICVPRTAQISACSDGAARSSCRNGCKSCAGTTGRCISPLLAHGNTVEPCCRGTIAPTEHSRCRADSCHGLRTSGKYHVGWSRHGFCTWAHLSRCWCHVSQRQHWSVFAQAIFSTICLSPTMARGNDCPRTSSGYAPRSHRRF